MQHDPHDQVEVWRSNGCSQLDMVRRMYNMIMFPLRVDTTPVTMSLFFVLCFLALSVLMKSMSELDSIHEIT